ncbi:MAG: hypothetical protein AAFO81_07840 [Pseudomonadota bacterium]
MHSPLTAQSTGRQIAMLFAVALLCQPIFALHAHAEDADPAPVQGIHDCAMCVLNASLDDDTLAVATDIGAPRLVRGLNAPTAVFATILLQPPERYRANPRAPPATLRR